MWQGAGADGELCKLRKRSFESSWRRLMWRATVAAAATRGAAVASNKMCSKLRRRANVVGSGGDAAALLMQGGRAWRMCRTVGLSCTSPTAETCFAPTASGHCAAPFFVSRSSHDPCLRRYTSDGLLLPERHDVSRASSSTTFMLFEGELLFVIFA
jgi:hypothetical protein